MAASQYIEFGQDLLGIVEGLDILCEVVSRATESLQGQTPYHVAARWDPISLNQIIGDYRSTLEECRDLLMANERYRAGSGPLRNLEWNVLVQPQADALRQRIMLHHVKIQHLLKPFEIDLLCRVRQDIANLQNDMARRITAVHRDIHRLAGVLVPDLELELNQQDQRRTFLLEVPVDLAERFRHAALTERPHYRGNEAFELEDMTDAFVLHYERSTIRFKGGMLVTQKIPPDDQFVNLLKCVWLFKRITICPAVRNPTQESHWPSYVRQLEDNLSYQCSRFGQDLVPPPLQPSRLAREVVEIWPQKEPTPLVPVVTQDEIMEQLLEVPLRSPQMNIEQRAKLLRRHGANGRRFRVMITGTEETGTGRPRQHTEVVDFDITAASISPQYALPGGIGNIPELILRRDERIANMRFIDMRDLLKFQQAVTGFKPFASHTDYDIDVTFIMSSKQGEIRERACLQLWIPKEVGGSLVTNSDVAADSGNVPSLSRSGSIAATSYGIPSATPTIRRGSFPTSPRSYSIGGEPLSSPMGRQPSLPTIPQRQTPDPGMFFTPWPRQTSPGPISSSPPTQGFYPPAHPPRGPVTRKPVGQPPSPRRSSTLATTTSNTTNGLPTPPERSYSISSTATSTSSGSDGKSVTISVGSRGECVLHRRPPKPMLVLFTRNFENGQFSFVTVQIDENTSINPDRCDCRTSGRSGGSCRIAAIEQRKGSENLSARRYESSAPPESGGGDWNMARLALNNPASTSTKAMWPKLQRVSIEFHSSRDRYKFSGLPTPCSCDTRDSRGLAGCLRAGHKGLWGEVQEIYRRDSNAYSERRNGPKQHVVNGTMT